MPKQDGLQLMAGVPGLGVSGKVQDCLNFLLWPLRFLMNTHSLDNRFTAVRQWIGVMDGRSTSNEAVLEILAADYSTRAEPEALRELIAKLFSRSSDAYKDVSDALGAVMGSPFTAEDAARVQNLADRVQRAEKFSSEELAEFKDLVNRASEEFPFKDWTHTLRKLILQVSLACNAEQVS